MQKLTFNGVKFKQTKNVFRAKNSENLYNLRHYLYILHNPYNILVNIRTIRTFWPPCNITTGGKKRGEKHYILEIYTPHDLPRTFLGRILKDLGLLTTFFRALEIPIV